MLNFRYLVGADNGPVRVDLRERCKTDPRVWEFYEAGGGMDFHMYSQHRDARSDWQAVIRAIDDTGRRSLRRSAARRGVSAAARVRPGARPRSELRQFEGASLLMAAVPQEVTKDAAHLRRRRPTLKTASGKRPFVMIDGFNLGLEKGTGVATYARNLSYALRDLSCDVGVSTAADSTRAMTRCCKRCSSSTRNSPTGRWAACSVGSAKSLASPSNTAFEVPVTGTVVADPFLSRLPHYDSIWNVPDLYQKASAQFELFA